LETRTSRILIADIIYLIRGFFSAGAGGTVNNGAVSSAGFCQKEERQVKREKRMVRTACYCMVK